MDARDRLLANPDFQRWAARFPLTRPIVRRRSRALFDLCAGFVYTQVLTAAVRLDLFAILAEGPQGRGELARRLGLTEEAAARLLDAAVALRLVATRGGGRYGLGPLGAAMVGNPGIAAMVEHHGMLYADLRDPVALLRGERSGQALAQFWPYADSARPDALGGDSVSGYSRLMAISQPMVAAEVLDSYALGQHRCLLDVGGGEGAFLAAAAAAVPGLELMLFDLPAVARRAEQCFASLGFADRLKTHGGDFLKDALPLGADIISLVRVLHDHEDDAVLTLLRAARRALPPGGTLLVAEPMAQTRGAEASGDAYFGFYLLAMGRGRPRTPGRIGRLAEAAGFANPRLRATHTPLLARVLVAEVPKS
ncbi:methyltransferase [Pelagibius sp.]|uniref:methyltransferase n=1 Tax=Pelagibius sp. TaxID=1931238 RepID=UPI0026029179|nr:methyltransferase [Pelagibius sp.]